MSDRESMQEIRDKLKKVGISVYPGCRVEAFMDYKALYNATDQNQELDGATSEFIGKLSDDDVLFSIFHSLRVSGLIAQLLPEDEEFG